MIAMPLYCARAAAISVARGEISAFAQRHFPLIVDELRLFVPAHDTRVRTVITRTSGGWVDLWPKWFRQNPDMKLEASQWEVSVERSDADSVADRRAAHEKQANQAAIASELPGTAFDAETMGVFTAAEPSKVVPEPSTAPWRSIGFMALVVVALLVAVGSGALPWLPVTTWVRWVGGGVAVLASVTAALWITGDRLSRWVRAFSVLIALFFCATLGFASSILVSQIASYWLTIPIAIAIIGIYFGWVHLYALHPGVRGLWSMPAISLLAAASAVIGQSSVALWLGSLGIPSAKVAVPGWFHLIVAVATAGVFVTVIVLVGSLCGWARYVGVGGGSLMERAQAFLGVLFVTLMWLLLTVATTLLTSSTAIGSWYAKLDEGGTPMLTAEFFYSGCIVDSGGDLERAVILEGVEGGAWKVAFSEGETETPVASATRIDAERFTVLRAGDADARCR
ncbi:hypothetical protein [Brachybacterium fresconis]|uniref:Uncharacterized protein n=1 Tax=Brachybacterium fresconis TaxID=173363 RepID=A0ABS4YN55_9MICO|nr:hypothetical protein [Brachybacterium fresconis]